MQRTKARISILIVVVFTTFAACLHFHQLLFLTNSETGLLTTEDGIMSYFIYGAIGLSLLFSCIFARVMSQNKVPTLIDKAPKTVKLTSFTLSIAFFIDFVHQVMNIIKYIDSTSYFELTTAVPIILVALFAFLSCFYYLIMGFSNLGINYDYKSFNLFHFVPVIWGFSRLFGILIQMVDIVSGIETMLEFLFIAFALAFLFSFVAALDNDGGKQSMTDLMKVAIIMSVSMTVIMDVPRIIIYIMGKGDVLYSVGFTCITDIMLALYAVSLLTDYSKRSYIEYLSEKSMLNLNDDSLDDESLDDDIANDNKSMSDLQNTEE